MFLNICQLTSINVIVKGQWRNASVNNIRTPARNTFHFGGLYMLCIKLSSRDTKINKIRSCLHNPLRLMGNTAVKHNYNIVQLSAMLELCMEHYKNHEGKVRVNFLKQEMCILMTVYNKFYHPGDMRLAKSKGYLLTDKGA